MSDYLIPRNGVLEHYYYSPGEGIMKKQRLPLNRIAAQCIYKDASDGFCAFADQNNCIHIISSNKNGDLVYLFEKNNSLQTHILLKGNGKIYPKVIRTATSNGRTNLLYSAEYNGEMLLIYCILGINAKPLHIDTLCADHPAFSILDNKVYYTNTQGTLGYMDFTDGKPDTFIPVAENAYMPCAAEFDGKEFLVYKQENCIICNGNKIFDDKHAADPLLCVSSGKLLLLWRSVNFIKYSASQNGGATWIPAMRFVNSGSMSHIYTLQNDNSFIDYYGTLSSGELHIIGANNILSRVQQQFRPSAQPTENFPDYADLKNELSLLRSEFSGLKNQLDALSSIINSKNSFEE